MTAADEVAELRHRVEAVEARVDVIEADLVALAAEVAGRRRWWGWWR